MASAETIAACVEKAALEIFLKVFQNRSTRRSATYARTWSADAQVEADPSFIS